MPEAVEDPASRIHRLRAATITALHAADAEFDALAEVCGTCVDLLPIDGAAISIVSAGRERQTMHASDAVIEQIESIQSTLGEGPGFEAVSTRRPVLIPELSRGSAASWPVFASEISALQVGAIFAFPLQIGAIAIGVIVFYRRHPGWFTDAELATALQLGDIAILALLGMQVDGSMIDSDDAGPAQLPHGGSLVHQATGMLIAEHHIPADQALARLRGYAFANGRLAEDVARDLTTRRISPADIDT